MAKNRLPFLYTDSFVLADAEVYPYQDYVLGTTTDELGSNIAIKVDTRQNPDGLLVYVPGKSNEKSILYKLHEMGGVALNGSEITVLGGHIPNLVHGTPYDLVVKTAKGHYKRVGDPRAKAMGKSKIGRDGHPHRPSYAINHSTEDRPPAPHIEESDRILYEMQIINFTKTRLDVPKKLRGKYLGASSPASIAHLKNLGVTTVQMMPIQQFDTNVWTRKNTGRRNHWGYGTTGFFAPQKEYASGKNPDSAVKEFKQMVDQFHEAGIEVVLDVVYNHLGANHSLEQLNKSGLYIPKKDGSGPITDYNGVGPAINAYNPDNVEFIVSSLKYWVEEMGVDGFRFDLGGALAKNEEGKYLVASNPLFNTINSDPVLKEKVKIKTAEQWSAVNWPNDEPDKNSPERLENNDIRTFNKSFLETMRRAWVKGHPLSPLELMNYMSGTLEGISDNYRVPNSINYATSHDGFTLYDLVSWSFKQNQKNQKENNGPDNEYNDNFGKDGLINPDTADSHEKSILENRLKAIRNIATTYLLAWGTPMIRSGDELGNTQFGNSNPWNGTKLVSWLKWDLQAHKYSQDILDYTSGIAKLRKRCHLYGTHVDMGAIKGSPVGELGIHWLNEYGSTITEKEKKYSKVFGMYSSGARHDKDSIIHYVNTSSEKHFVSLPNEKALADNYSIIVNSVTGEISLDNDKIVKDGFWIPPHSQIVLKRIRNPEALLGVKTIGREIGKQAIKEATTPHLSA